LLITEVNMGFNIAIDGPAGAGKSTIAKGISKKLGFIYVDTGAMYRALALYFIRNRIRSDEEEKMKELLTEVDVTITYLDGMQQVILNGENVTPLIRSEDVGKMASESSVYQEVRAKLLNLQRNLANTADVIMDGRDIGTYVLPDADLKIYLTAGVKERANRRFLELKEEGISCELLQIEKDIEDRDYRDMHREIAPLRQAADAVCIDSSLMTIDKVINTIIEIYEKKVKD